MKLHPQYYCII